MLFCRETSAMLVTSTVQMDYCMIFATSAVLPILIVYSTLYIKLTI